MSPPEPPEHHVALDLETHGVSPFSMGPEYFRIGGYSCTYGERNSPDVHVTADPQEIMRIVNGAATVTGHNLLGFDAIVLAKFFGLDVVELTRQGRLRDTMLIAFLDDPPPARMNAGQIDKYYSLNSVSERLFDERKAVDVSKQLVKEYGSWGEIPRGEPRFHSYLDQDVVLTGAIADELCDTTSYRALWPYAEREHRIAAVCAQITLNGFRVDEPEVRKRVAAGEQKRSEIISRLVEDHGLPTTRKDGSPSSAPQNTQAGRAAVKRAFEQIGCKHMPKTEKGAWGTGRESMDKMKEHYGTDAGKLSPEQQGQVVELADTIQALNGVRTVFETTANNMVEDSTGWRVHPQIALRQASGRLSFSKPGLTVMGKRSGRHHEREIFIAEPGEVITAVDLDQIDARAVAALCQDPAYMAMFEGERDLHSEVSMRVFGTVKMREQAKICCVPLDSEILTREGWKTWDQVVPDEDETLGLDANDTLTWTPITAVNTYENADVVRMQTRSFDVTCTPNHRWVSDYRTMVNKKRGYRRRIVQADGIAVEDNLILAAPADTERGLNISLAEAELLGWIIGDGNIRWTKIDSGRTSQSHGDKRGVSVTIEQSKEWGKERIRELVTETGVEWTEGKASPSGFDGKLEPRRFYMRAAGARNLMERAGLTKNRKECDLDSFVLAMDSEQRQAFLNGFWGAEGHNQTQTVKGRTYSPRVVSQVDEQISDAIRLAVFLTGHRPNTTRSPNKSGTVKQVITYNGKPHVTGQKMTVEDVGSAPVWCPTTGLGTWVMRQNGQASLTGNSHAYNYGIGVDGLVKQAGVEHKIAVQFVREMREQFPRLNEWKQERAEIASAGHLLDNGFGRKMKPDRQRAHTQGPALSGQSAARDLLCEGVLRLIDKHPSVLPMLRGIIHDELVVSAPVDIVDDVEKAIVDAMTFEWAPPQIPDAKPIRVTAGAGKRAPDWGTVYAKD